VSAVRVGFSLSVALLLACLLAACGGGTGTSVPAPPGSPSTTLAAETANNTSAADSFTALSNGDAGAGNVSKLPISSLLYPGSTTKVYAHLMGWFGGSSHMNVGYSSNDSAQVHRQVADMMSRGIAGAILDWHGPASATINQTATLLRKEAEAQNGKFSFAMVEDVGALASAAMANHCDVTDQVIDDLDSIAANFSGSSAYLKLEGRPVVFFFGVDTYYIDWDRVASSAGNFNFVFRGKGGLSHAHAAGAFQWVDHNSSDPSNLELAAQDQFYSAAAADPSQIAFGSAYSGFNDTLAGWGTDRLLPRDCGQTWLDTFNEVSKFYSASHQLDALQLVTWNDYEEGTAIESGIDNCMYLTPSISGTTLHWNIAGGNENTVDHYVIFSSSDGQHLTSLGSAPAGKQDFDLSSVSQASVLYVKAVGKPSIQNKISPAIAYVPGHQSPMAELALTQAGPLTVAASTAGSTGSGKIANSKIDFGDGTVADGPHATHTYSNPGIFNVVATVTDEAGASAVAVERISAKSTAPGVKIFAPADGATVNWPTSFVASANLANPVTGMKILVDGQVVYAASSDVLNTALKIYRGAHEITVQAADSTGATSSATINITAEPGDMPPMAAIETLPLPTAGSNAILACTANSSDPDGFVNARQVQFSDGTVIKAAGAVHNFAAPGTYSATATVTDQYGATDSASESVTVSAH
jgi:PKD repeat protein